MYIKNKVKPIYGKEYCVKKKIFSTLFPLENHLLPYVPKSHRKSLFGVSNHKHSNLNVLRGSYNLCNHSLEMRTRATIAIFENKSL